MKTITLLILFLFGSNLLAETEIDLSRFAELIRFPGLKLELVDYTERESAIREIKFQKAIYLKVVGERFIYPAVIYISPKGSIEKNKYDELRNLLRAADVKQAARLKEMGYIYFPDLDETIVCMDEIRMSVLNPSLTLEGESWNAPFVGGLSITGSSVKYGVDFQIFLTGQAENDPTMLANYRKGNADLSPDKYHNQMKELIQLIRGSPMLAAQSVGGETHTGLVKEGQLSEKVTKPSISIVSWLSGAVVLLIVSILILVLKHRSRRVRH